MRNNAELFSPLFRNVSTFKRLVFCFTGELSSQNNTRFCMSRAKLYSFQVYVRLNVHPLSRWLLCTLSNWRITMPFSLNGDFYKNTNGQFQSFWNMFLAIFFLFSAILHLSKSCLIFCLNTINQVHVSLLQLYDAKFT